MSNTKTIKRIFQFTFLVLIGYCFIGCKKEEQMFAVPMDISGYYTIKVDSMFIQDNMHHSSYMSYSNFGSPEISSVYYSLNWIVKALDESHQYMFSTMNPYEYWKVNAYLYNGLIGYQDTVNFQFNRKTGLFITDSFAFKGYNKKESPIHNIYDLNKQAVFFGKISGNEYYASPRGGLLYDYNWIKYLSLHRVNE